MPSLLSQLPQLSRFCGSSHRGLFSDVDGTLSHIVPNPDEATVSPNLRGLLSGLSQRLDVVAVISGRRAEQARQMIGLPNLVYVGNHGWEWWQDGALHWRNEAEGYLSRMAAALEEIGRLLHIDGIVLENKGPTATIHYRRCSEEAHPREAILAAVAASPAAQGLRSREGKKIIDLLPPLDMDKGTALAELLARFQLDTALYLGDDLTDVNAFRALHSWRDRGTRWAAAVAVVDRESSPLVTEQADFTLAGVAEVEQLLEWLVDALG